MSWLTKIIRGLVYLLLILIILGATFYLSLSLLTKPSNDRPWAKDMAELASATIDGNLITLHNIRSADYRTTTDYDLHYYDEIYDLDKIQAVYFFTDPFGSLSAHTMMGFEFSDGKKVVLSVEIRREVGEEFATWRGFLNQYELIYVWAAETDVLKLRTNYRLDTVYMYPLNMSKENMVKLFTEAVNRTNELYVQPEFYNVLLNNCTTNLINQLQKVYNKRIIFNWRYLAPAYSEQLGLDYDLITGGRTIDEVRAKSNISSEALKCGNLCFDYSKAIRKIF